jgi:hypothetical protein
MNLKTAQFLLSPEGREAAASVSGNVDDSLSAGTFLRKKYPDIDPSMLASVIELAQTRVRGESKFPRAGELFFERAALEQSTGITVANHRAERFYGVNSACDGSAGIGGDSIALGKVVKKLTCVEIDPARSLFLRENLAIHGIDADIVEGNILDMKDRVREFDALYLDPARRCGSKRTRKLFEMEPSIAEVEELVSQTKNACVKLPTGVSGDDISVPCELEWVSVDSGLKEAVMWTGDFMRCGTTVSLLHKNAVLTDSELPDVEPEIRRAGKYLYEPDPALIRSGLLGRKAASLGMSLISADIAYMSSDTPVPDPFFRAFRITGSMKFNLKKLNEALGEMDAGNVTVKKRGFPMLPEEVISKLRLKGSKHVTVVLTQEMGGHVVYFVEPL